MHYCHVHVFVRTGENRDKFTKTLLHSTTSGQKLGTFNVWCSSFDASLSTHAGHARQAENSPNYAAIALNLLLFMCRCWETGQMLLVCVARRRPALPSSTQTAGTSSGRIQFIVLSGSVRSSTEAVLETFGARASYYDTLRCFFSFVCHLCVYRLYLNAKCS